MENKIRKIHSKLFNEDGTMYIKTPSRINFIGEHLDYNGGKVMPACIDLYMHGIASKSNKIEIYSENFKNLGILRKDIDDKEFIDKEQNLFMNYVDGCIKILIKNGHDIKGIKLSIFSEIPPSSGLSSSAALGVLVLKCLNKLYKLSYSNQDIAKLFKIVENKYMNLNNGIMDQFIISCGEEKKVMYLDTNNLKYENYLLELVDWSFVIINTNKKRNLIDSKFNERVKECNDALKIINSSGYNFKNLCSMPIKNINYFSKLIKNKTIRKRYEYIIEEQNRTSDFRDAIKKNDIYSMGKILNEGHEGLKNKYQVSCSELDYINNELNKHKDVLGVRMTGAGFGGCCIVLIKNDSIEEIFKIFKNKYMNKFGYKCDMYKINIVSGVVNG